MKKLTVILLAFALIFSLAACGATGTKEPAGTNKSTDAAADYPGSELHIQVPFKTGGAIDVQVRTTAKYLEKVLDTTVIIDNTAGAGGLLGTTEYLKEDANTTTLLLTDAWLMAVTPMIQEVEYTDEDFVPVIGHNAGTPGGFCLFANPSVTGINSYEDLVAYGKNHRVLFGSGGPGTSLYVLSKSVFSALNIDCDSITQNSTSEGLVNLIAGTVDVTLTSFESAADYVTSGEIVPIMCFIESAYSDDTYTTPVPCAKELGIDIVFENFNYYSIRKGTDEAIIKKLQDAFLTVYSDPDFIAEAEKVGYNPMSTTTDGIYEEIETLSNTARNAFVLD